MLLDVAPKKKLSRQWREFCVKTATIGAIRLTGVLASPDPDKMPIWVSKDRIPGRHSDCVIEFSEALMSLKTMVLPGFCRYVRSTSECSPDQEAIALWFC